MELYMDAAFLFHHNIRSHSGNSWHSGTHVLILEPPVKKFTQGAPLHQPEIFSRTSFCCRGILLFILSIVKWKCLTRSISNAPLWQSAFRREKCMCSNALPTICLLILYLTKSTIQPRGRPCFSLLLCHRSVLQFWLTSNQAGLMGPKEGWLDHSLTALVFVIHWKQDNSHCHIGESNLTLRPQKLTKLICSKNYCILRACWFYQV